MRHQLLRDSDWTGMAHSVEIRAPFVDVDFLRAIAPLLASGAPPSKRDMAECASPLVTQTMLRRANAHPRSPIRGWLRHESRRAGYQRTGRAQRGLRGWACEVY